MISVVGYWAHGWYLFLEKGVAMPQRIRQIKPYERRQVMKLCRPGRRVEVRLNGSPGVKLMVMPRTSADADSNSAVKFRLAQKSIRDTDHETRKWIQTAELDGVSVPDLVGLSRDGKLFAAS